VLYLTFPDKLAVRTFQVSPLGFQLILSSDS